jgi:hypothetical protein
MSLQPSVSLERVPAHATVVIELPSELDVATELGAERSHSRPTLRLWPTSVRVSRMSNDLFTDRYLVAYDLAAEARIDRDDDPAAESARWCPPHLEGDDALEWTADFESWWEPAS